jgi:hypothetical protein
MVASILGCEERQVNEAAAVAMSSGIAFALEEAILEGKLP